MVSLQPESFRVFEDTIIALYDEIDDKDDLDFLASRLLRIYDEITGGPETGDGAYINLMGYLESIYEAKFREPVTPKSEEE